MGNKTTTLDALFGGFVAMVILKVATFYLPDFMATVTAGEQDTFMLVAIGIAGFFLPENTTGKVAAKVAGGTVNSHWLFGLVFACMFILGGCETIKQVPVVGQVVEWLTPDDVCKKKFPENELHLNACRAELGFQAEYNRLTKAFNAATTQAQVNALAAQRKEVDNALRKLRAIQSGVFIGDPASTVDAVAKRLEEMSQ